MLAKRSIRIESARRLTVTAALLFVLGFAFAAGPAWAAPGDCTDPTTCGGGGGEINSPPAVAANNASVTVPEGSVVSNTGTFSDPDGNATVTLSASVGSVSKDDAAGTWNWTFNTNDGPDQNQTVTITATDGTDTVSTTFSLTVNNVAPTVNLQNSFPSVPEGGSFALGYTSYGYNLSVSDPGNDTWTLNTGCGSNGSEWQESSSVVWCGFFDGPATGTVSATATDSDGASRTATVNVTITNRNPGAVLDAPASINEGGTATISLIKGNFVSPQDGQIDMTAGLHYAFDCNGGSLGGATYASSGTAASTDCAFDDNGTKTVRARIFDKDGGSNEYTKTITVNNVAPTATFEAPAAVDQGSNFPLSLANVTDPSSADRDTLSYAFDCGNGSGYVASSTASKSCTALDQPNMTVKGKVTDKDGGTNEYTKTVSVNNVAPTGTIKVNDDAAATNNAMVNLALSATDPLPGSGVGHMRFRNENTDTWSAWEPFATSRSWLLSSGDGAKTVYVEYRDNAGNVSTAAIQDGIQLDTTPPPPPPADTTKPTIGGVLPRHKSVIRDTTPTIKATVKDNRLLGKANIKLYVAGKRISAAKLRYTASTGSLLYNSPKLPKGKKTVKIVATDAASNVGTKSWSFTIK